MTHAAMESAVPAPNERGRRKLILHRLVAIGLPILVIALAVGSTVAMSALSPEPEETEDPIKALPVLTAMAKADSVQMSVRAQGEVQPRTEINLVGEVSGRITYMAPNFLEGAQFSRGDLLVRIDPTEYRLRVTQAEANVRQAETVLAREQSEAALARMDWEDLGSGGEATPLTLREPQMAEAAAQLESAKARLAEAKLQLSRTQVRAPFSGRVIERQVNAGEFVNQNGTLGRVYATDIMDVRLPMTQSDLRQAGLYLGFEADYAEGLPVTLSANIAGRLQQWDGRITRTDARFDATSRVLHVYAEVRDPFARNNSDQPPLAPGLFVDATIDGPTIGDVVTVPRAALRGQDKVYVAQSDDTLLIRTVEVQSSERDQVVLSRGLSGGETVVISPIRGAADGMKIEIVNNEDGEG